VTRYLANLPTFQPSYSDRLVNCQRYTDFLQYFCNIKITTVNYIERYSYIETAQEMEVQASEQDSRSKRSGC
jgi:hypothetical protein